MAVSIATGALLILLTWALGPLVVGWSGRWAPALIDRRAPANHRWQAGIWWGLALLVVTVVAVGLAAPLGGGTAAAMVIGILVAATGLGTVVSRPSRPRWRRTGRAVLGFLIILGASLAYLAVKALGPVSNYDSGLYHLGAVKYAAEFSTIPGLATLFFPFGYANAQFPLAAFLGNGPWDGVGYRLLNGAVLVLASSDLASRLLHRRWSWGTFVLLVGLSAALVPLVAMADSLVTSPTADTSVLILTVVSSAYLADALSRRHPPGLDASVAVVLAGVLVMLRPTMGFFAVATVLVVGALLWRRRGARVSPWLWGLTGGALVAMAVVTLLRDRVLSGWLLYPLSILPLDVPWRAIDPTGWRDATLAAARDPLAPDGFVVAHSWQWIGPWMERLPTQWEPWFVLVGFAAAVVAWITARQRVGFPASWRALGAGLAPSVIAVIAWFVVSPPSFRFIWGPLFSLLFLVIGAALVALSRSPRPWPRPRGTSVSALVACAVVVGLVTGYSTVARNQVGTITEGRDWTWGPVSIRYAVTPIPQPPVIPVEMRTGLVLETPEVGDQCWDNWPLCSFNMGDGIGLRGGSIQEGFTWE